MKQTGKLLLAVVLFAGVMASCKKDKKNNLTDNTTTTTTTTTGVGTAGGGSDMSYKVSLNLNDTNNIPSIIAWASGYVHVTGLHFEANMLNDTTKNGNKGNGNNNGNGNSNSGKGNGNGGSNNGNGPVTHVHYNSSTATQIDLFNPGLLGAVNIPYGTYDNIIVKVQVAPAGAVHSLYLLGAVSVNGLVVPVEVIVDDRIDLMAKWMQPVTIDGNMNYFSNLTLSLGQLATGIDATMLQNLVITNGKIIISANTNAGIYKLLLANMQGMLKVKVQ